MPRTIALALVMTLFVAACASSDDDAAAGEPAERAGPAEASADPLSVDPSEELSVDATWQWQLQGEINTSYDVDIYDIDLFDAPQTTIDHLRADGRIVICYFSAGSFESWRDDARAFETSAIGKTLDGWDDERWVDTRSESVRSALADRLDLAATRGCDGVEPDNVTAFQNDSGFELTADDQLDFNRFLADSAHERDLLIGLKNDLGQIPALVGSFDFAINEECLQYDECEAYAPFVDAGKVVLSAEYDAAAVNDVEATCATAATRGLRTVILPVELDDSFRVSCD